MRIFPFDIVKNILGYDKRFLIKGEKIMNIGKIYRNDERYNLLRKIPRKIHDKDDIDSITYVFLKISEEKCYCIIYDSIKGKPRFQIQVIGLTDSFTFFETSDFHYIT
jgi:hypothetical protein